MTEVWDRKLVVKRPNGRNPNAFVAVHLPMPISKHLLGLRLNRVRIEVTEGGILLVPYRQEDDLPEGWLQ